MFFLLVASCHKSCHSCCCNKCHSWRLYIPYLEILCKVDSVGCFPSLWVVWFIMEIFSFSKWIIYWCACSQARVTVFIQHIQRICVVFAVRPFFAIRTMKCIWLFHYAKHEGILLQSMCSFPSQGELEMLIVRRDFQF